MFFFLVEYSLWNCILNSNFVISCNLYYNQMTSQNNLEREREREWLGRSSNLTVLRNWRRKKEILGFQAKQTKKYICHELHFWVVLLIEPSCIKKINPASKLNNINHRGQLYYNVEPKHLICENKSPNTFDPFSSQFNGSTSFPKHKSVQLSLIKFNLCNNWEHHS